MRVSVYGTYLKTDGEIGKKMDEESKKSFKQADKIIWRLNLVDTVLLIVVVAVIVVSIAK